ncbi:peroxidase 7 [Curcuma longa]|uniref:peroxidase 7 n=1 Tax=Curcuma longa TaxID=136217 RepID=UPI003D9E3B77
MTSSPLHILFFLLLLPYLLTAALAGPPADDNDLTQNYYSRSCPRFEETVGRKIDYWHSLDSSLSPSLIHLLFFDCAVRGCDASILLNNTGGERRSPAAASLRGFHVIDDIKAELEKTCPETVSCADILVAAAREATRKAGGPYWDNVYGRKDGRISISKEAEAVPSTGRESITELIDFFDSLDLDILDLVVLSGAHTIGKATCGAIQHRLYNYGGVAGKSDPSIDSRYVNYLKRKCRRASTEVDFDPTTPTKFDNEYYRNLKRHMGLLATDQLLASDSRTESLVEGLASQEGVFKHQFAKSMKKLAETLMLEGDEGEVRINCNLVNKKKY